jgi:predicted site-specific integrase-resolvase
MKPRPSKWAARQRISSIPAKRWAKAGEIGELHRDVSDRLFVESEAGSVRDGDFLYGCSSSADPTEDLDRLSARLRDFAAALWAVVVRRPVAAASKATSP